MLSLTDEKPAFVVDAMLGNLAKKLRMLGYDSYYSSSIDDSDLIDTAKNEHRIIITRDENLIKSATKKSIPAIFITKNTEADQLIQINQNVKLEKFTISGTSTRCPICNGKLQYTEKAQILNRVPKGVLEKNKEFWICNDCKKIYWEGTHIENLQKFVAELNERL